MHQRIGTCSLCGGDVVGFRGAWGATIPPPPDKCSSCGAVACSDVIKTFKPNNNRKTKSNYFLDNLDEEV